MGHVLADQPATLHEDDSMTSKFTGIEPASPRGPSAPTVAARTTAFVDDRRGRISRDGEGDGGGDESQVYTRSILEANDVNVRFGPTPALIDVSVEFGAGTSTSVVGASGSGKSTLLHCLSGLRRPDSGTITIEDWVLTAADDNERSRRRLTTMGIVFQFGELVPELSILDNVALPAWIGGGTRADALAAARELLATFGIADVADQHPGRVSGGQRQRAAVARALVHRPRIVFADEPTGALDSDNADIVVDTLVAETARRGAALVLVTHEARLAARTDRTIVLSDGRIVDERWNR